MRSSENVQNTQQENDRRKSPGRIIAAILAGVIVFLVLLWFIDKALYPCTYQRYDVHRITTEPVDALILGTSCGKMGIDPDYLFEGTGLTGHNLAAGSEYPVDSYYLAQLAEEKKPLKMIIYDVDPGYFTTEKEKGNNYLLFHHEFPLSWSKIRYSAAILADSDIRGLFFPFYEYPIKTTFSRMKDSLTKKFTGDYSIDSLKNSSTMYHENGYIERFPVSEENFPDYDPEPFSRELLVSDNVKYLEKLIDFCENNDIVFVAVTMPMPDYSIENNKESLNAAWDYFEEFFGERGIDYYNFNTSFYDACSHKAENYVDYTGHLNGDSAREFSKILGGMLQN